MNSLQKIIAVAVIFAGISLGAKARATTLTTQPLNLPAFPQFKPLTNFSLGRQQTPAEWTERLHEIERQRKLKAETTANEVKFGVLGGIALLALLGKALGTKKA